MHGNRIKTNIQLKSCIDSKSNREMTYLKVFTQLVTSLNYHWEFRRQKTLKYNQVVSSVNLLVQYWMHHQGLQMMHSQTGPYQLFNLVSLKLNRLGHCLVLVLSKQVNQLQILYLELRCHPQANSINQQEAFYLERVHKFQPLANHISELLSPIPYNLHLPLPPMGQACLVQQQASQKKQKMKKMHDK